MENKKGVKKVMVLQNTKYQNWRSPTEQMYMKVSTEKAQRRNLLVTKAYYNVWYKKVWRKKKYLY